MCLQRFTDVIPIDPYYITSKTEIIISDFKVKEWAWRIKMIHTKEPLETLSQYFLISHTKWLYGNETILVWGCAIDISHSP